MKHCIDYNLIALTIKFNWKIKGFELKQLLSDNNKRGRPPKAKPALVRDDDDADKPSQVPRSNINVRPYRKQN